MQSKADVRLIGEINEAGGVLTFFIPAKNTGDF